MKSWIPMLTSNKSWNVKTNKLIQWLEVRKRVYNSISLHFTSKRLPVRIMYIRRGCKFLFRCTWITMILGVTHLNKNVVRKLFEILWNEPWKFRFPKLWIDILIEFNSSEKTNLENSIIPLLNISTILCL